MPKSHFRKLSSQGLERSINTDIWNKTAIVSLDMVSPMVMLLMVFNMIMVEESRNVLQIRGQEFDDWEEMRQEIEESKRRPYFLEAHLGGNKEYIRKQIEVKEWIKRILNDEKTIIVPWENLGRFGIKMSKVEEQQYEPTVAAVDDSELLGDVRKMMKKLYKNQILWTRV